MTPPFIFGSISDYFVHLIPEYTLIPIGCLARDQIEISIKGSPPFEIRVGSEFYNLATILYKSMESIINLYKETFAMSKPNLTFRPNSNEICLTIQYIKLEYIKQYLKDENDPNATR